MRLVVLACLALLLVTCTKGQTSKRPERLNWLPQVEHGGRFAAPDYGYYANELGRWQTLTDQPPADPR